MTSEATLENVFRWCFPTRDSGLPMQGAGEAVNPLLDSG